MFSSSTLALILSAASVMASHNQQQARSHHAVIAKRADNTTEHALDKRAQFTNKEFTWYPTDTGPDACTGKNHKDSDWYVAMGYNQWGDGSACCGRQLKITVNGKTTTATCVDQCATCPDVGQLDFTKDLFKFFSNGDLDVGVLHGSWSYADGNDGGDDHDDPPPPPKTTTTKKHTTTPPPPPKTTSTTHVQEFAPKTTKKTTSSAKPKTSSKPSSSAKPSSSTKKSSSAKPSSTAAKSSSSAAPPAVPTEAVANAGNVAGSSAGSAADDSDNSKQISGAIGQGGSSDAMSLSFNKLLATAAFVALLGAQAL
ncbi:hypothetical protein R3P38DRAFT_2826718 [Favolaschia claudopus]|uniref:RlpA-like double-psi beta-barrel-protein domain-containing protein-containing protein n=1 Tax=Favolaschia claudopus TaxID=2862362 RepID=A0AAW0EJB9_9AGAR